jgi:proline iminopeptidase
LAKTLPDSLGTAIEMGERSGNYDSPQYIKAIRQYYHEFIARKLPWDENMINTVLNQNSKMYHYMWGPTQFNATKDLKNFDRVDELAKIKVPTLYLCGQFDQARPLTVKYYQSLTPGSKFAVIKDAGLNTMHDNPQQNNQTIADFLHKIEIQ